MRLLLSLDLLGLFSTTSAKAGDSCAPSPERVTVRVRWIGKETGYDIQMRNRTWECIGAPEWQAYKLHEKWLLERGIDPEFNWLLIYIMSRCPRDSHPD